MRRAGLTILGCGLLALLVVQLPVSAASRTASSNEETYIVFAGSTTQLVAEEQLATDCTTVYLTHDFTHFGDITPSAQVWRNPPRYGGSCAWVSYQAVFVTPQDGWIMARNAGSDTTVLAHTADGGNTWTREPGSSTGSNGGYEVIGFSGPLDGWRQQFAFGASAGPFLLQHTTDAGASWTTVNQSSHADGCSFDQDLFPTPDVGFQADDSPFAYRTADGGSRWSRFVLQRPNSVPTGWPALYGLPYIAGEDGAVAVTYPSPNAQLVAFFLTDNGGTSWHLGGTVNVHAGLEFETPFECGLAPLATAPLVVTSAAGPGAWWILLGGAAGHALVFTVTLHNVGLSTVVHHAVQLPATVRDDYVQLFAASAADAMLDVDNSGTTRTYVTENGGSTWRILPLGTP
jgi:photosystem II stability/assembly factor-like uncharacterized protein